MKKFYETPDVEINRYFVEDIILISGDYNPDEGIEDGGEI